MHAMANERFQRKEAVEKATGGRVPPQNIESERALLGALMLKPDAIHDVIDLVSSDDFYVAKHRTIFDAILSLFHKGEPIDILSLTSRLKEEKKLQAIGGASELTELVSETPAASNVMYYANLVRKSAVLRRLIFAGEHISELGFDASGELDETLDKAEKRIYDVTNISGSRKFQDIRSLTFETIERIDRLHKSDNEFRGVRTGFSELDNKLSGLQKSDLIILAARPSMGKTAFALDIARQAAVQHNIPVGIFSLEMSAQQLVDRMLGAEAKVDAWKLRTGKLSTDEEFEQIHAGLDRLSNAPIFIDDQPMANIITMRSVARRLKREKGLGLIVVDYLQLMAPTSTRSSDSLVQQVTEISRSLKALARELEVPVLALSQLSRAVEQRRGRPRLSDLRDSGSIEQDADVVMFIHREDKMQDGMEKNNIAEILIEKHRNGPTGKVDLYFDEGRVTFQSIEKSSFGAYQGSSVEEF